MKNYLQKLAALSATLLLTLNILAPIGASATSHAENRAVNDICRGVDIGAGGTCQNRTGGRAVERLVKLGINVFSLIVGVIAIIMIIISGLKYITSAGDPTNVNSAKNTILYAIIGLVIVAAAQFIVRFVLDRASG